MRRAVRRQARKPKRWKDADMLARFAAAHPHDEIERWLAGQVWQQVQAGYVRRSRLETCHIFHAGKRADFWWNLVRGTSRAHYYTHRDPIGGTIAAMWAVLARLEADAARVATLALIRSEWNLAEGFNVLGRLLGHLECGRVPEHYAGLAGKVLGAFDGAM